MTHFAVLYDACVLYPAPLRDLLMHLALMDLYRAKWTEEIHDEWTRNVLKKRPDLTKEILDRTRTLMNSHVRDCLIYGYQDLVPILRLPDPNDRHVLAAAIHGKCEVIVTTNLKDFPEKTLKKYNIEAQHPDQFIAYLFDLSPESVCIAAKRQRSMLKNPPKTVDEYLETLKIQSLYETVKLLENKKNYL